MRDFVAPWNKQYRNGVWYEVDQDCGDYLRTVNQIPGNPHTPLAFDVATLQEAEELRAREEQQALGKVVKEIDMDPGPIAPTKAMTSKVSGKLNRPTPTHELSAGAAAREDGLSGEGSVTMMTGPDATPGDTSFGASAGGVDDFSGALGRARGRRTSGKRKPRGV